MLPKYNNQLLKDFQLLDYYPIVQKHQFDYVYPPGDDSYFMLTILNQQINSNQIRNYQIIAEVGCGSGILLAHLYYWLNKKNQTPLIAFSTDINYDACTMAQKYYKKYDLKIQTINTSILNNIKLKPSLILCNPPYIPTQKQQQQQEKKRLKNKLKDISQKRFDKNFDNNLIAYSWMGGQDGMIVVWKLLQRVDWKCTIYFVLIGENPINIFKYRAEKAGFIFTLLGIKQKYNQILHIVKITNF